MKDFKTECIEDTDVTNIKFEEKKKIIIFLNTERKPFAKVQVDGCQITEGIRCDKLLVDKTNGDEYFVELKGMDVGHALLQLERSMELLSDKDCRTKKVKAYVISSNAAPKLNSKRQTFEKRCKQKYGKDFTLTVKERRWKVQV